MILKELFKQEPHLCVGHHFITVHGSENFITKYYIDKWKQDWLNKHVISWSYKQDTQYWNKGAEGHYHIKLGYKEKWNT